jgi:WD40 repeat protein
MAHKHRAGRSGDSGSRRILQILILAAVAFCQFGSAHAAQMEQTLPTEPMLRIEAGQHIGIMFRIDTDAANRFAITASYDKTVRVWSLRDGRPQRVLRLPIGDGYIGQAYAVAISPDGDTIAVGGWTGSRGHHNIFVFDRGSGNLRYRLPDLPNVINHLVYSADGRRLAASLKGNNGIRVFDAANGYRLLPSDSQYGGDSYGAHFDRTGRLVTTSYDGFVRLYAADKYATPIARFEWKDHRPYQVAFSPDGARVAVGASDKHDVVVLSGSDLTQLFQPHTADIPNDDAMGAVAWSQDGSFLYAAGDWRVNSIYQVRRWSNGGRGDHIDIPLSTGIRDLIGLNSGILIGGTVGSAIISPDAKVTPLQTYGALDLRGGGDRVVRVSADGSIVEVDSWEPAHSYRFALADRLVRIDPPADSSLKGPITRAPGLDIANWNASTSPTVNGTGIQLEQFERSHSVAIVPGTKHFVLGADFGLRLLDERGQNVWPSAQPVPGIAWRVNVSANGRLVIAASGDGTVRWYRLSDGKELLAFFIHPDGQRWVAWTPQGYYDASTSGDELIGWHINHGYDRAPDFHPVSQFRDRFYRPDVIQRVLQTPNLDVEEAVRDADRARGRPATRAAPVASLLTPVIQIHAKDPTPADRTELQLGYSVRMPSASDSLRVEALIDGAKVTAEDQALVPTGDTRAGVLKFTVPRRDSVVSVVAYNANGASTPASIHVQWRGPGTDPKLSLYVLAIGISDYKDKNVSLKFAAKDAADFVALAKKQEGGLYEKVIPYSPRGSLQDADATRDEILNGLDWITRAVTNTNDVAMIFLAGHGITTPDLHYRFLPYDYDANRIPRTTITDSEFEDYLTKIGGKKIFFFDTCYSGNVLKGRAPGTAPDVDRFANQLRAAENGIVVFTSSTGNELSQELEQYKNGAFTLAVVEGMRGAAARPQTPVIMISDLQGYVSKRVRDLTKGNQKPMVAMPKTVEDYPISIRLP